MATITILPTLVSAATSLIIIVQHLIMMALVILPIVYSVIHKMHGPQPILIMMVSTSLFIAASIKMNGINVLIAILAETLTVSVA
jgi:hypothetical protein